MSLVASLMVLAAAATAAAHPPDSKPTAQASSHEADVGLARMADCVIRQKGLRADAQRFLRLPADAPTAKELGVKLMTVDCLDKAIPKSIAPNASERSARAGYLGPQSFGLYELKAPTQEYRAALFAALYRYSFGKTGPGAIAGKPPLSVSSEWDDVPDPLPAGWRARRAIGDCMARGHPMAAHRLILSTPWSTAEDSEIGEITTALAECLPEGQTVSVGREDLRGIVGEALYKLAIAPEAPSETGPAKAN